jgi:hypothetical protein
MTDNVNPVCFKKMITMERRTIPEKDARHGSEIHLVTFVWSRMGKTLKTKNLENRMIGWLFKKIFEGEMWEDVSEGI